MKKFVLMDIDGCVLDIDHRVPFLEVGDYEAFVAHHIYDTPIEPGAHIYANFLDDPNFVCVFVTSRSEANRDWTLKQLRQLFGDVDFNLLMRPINNMDEDPALKLKLIAEANIKPNQVFIAFDDRPSVVAAYRRLGIISYQTAEGW